MYNVLASDNRNLSAAQQELLGWHFKLGHFNLCWIQALTRPRNQNKFLVPTRLTGGKTCDIPLCESCFNAKATTLPDLATKTVICPSKDRALKKNILQPGSIISTNQYVSSVRGRLPHTKGKEKEQDQYSGGTIYVDDASSLIFLTHQVLLKAEETIWGKRRFEQFASTCGVDVTGYCGDNRFFKSNLYQQDL